jgi:hypothetical protein
MILSDLPVHREQVADGAVYFDPGKAEDCARVLGFATGNTPLRSARPEEAANEHRQQVYAERFREAAKSAADNYAH